MKPDIQEEHFLFPLAFQTIPTKMGTNNQIIAHECDLIDSHHVPDAPSDGLVSRSTNPGEIAY